MGNVDEREIFLTYDNQDYEYALDYAYYPIYLECYKKCIRNIFTDFVRREKEKSNCNENFEYVCRDNASRVESFLGGRGTGKSTAMVEFCKILESLNNTKNRKWWLEQSIQDKSVLENVRNKEFKFKVIDVVDAGNLEDKEDLFELILAAIFKDYQKMTRNCKTNFEDYGHENKDIIRLFSNIMEGYYSIKNAKREEFGDSYVARLKSMSTSIDIRNEISKLLDKLFDKMSNKNDNCFLVIAVDDLDINVTHGYEMLEQLHKYFFLHNVIILLSGDYKQLEYVCKYHYIRGFVHDTSQSIDDIMEQSQELAKDYITKVLPINMRVYMPKFNSESRGICVDEKYTLKTYIIFKIANKLKIFFDIKGLKTHFVEVKTVRELILYSRFIDSLFNIDEYIDDTKKYLDLYDQNLEQYYSDFESRIAGKILSKKQIAQYVDIMDKKLEKQIVSIHEFMYDEIKSNDSVKEPWAEKSITYDVENYRYGDLLYEIYQYGRIHKENKGMVKCFLASLTIQMQMEKIHYYHYNRSGLEMEQNVERAKRAEKNLYKLIGNAVCNEWMGEMLPKLQQPDNSYYQESRIKLPSIGWGSFSDSAARNVKFSFRNIVFDSDTLLSVLNCISENKIISIIECFAMFLRPQKDSGEWVEFELDYNKNEKCVDVNLVNENVEFDILGFIRKSVDWKRKVDSLHLKLQSMIISFITTVLDIKISVHEYNIFVSKVRNTIEQDSILNKEWKHEDISAFPFYNLDLSYNVLKRVRRNLKESNKENIYPCECYEYVKKVYSTIGAELESEDKAFESIGLNSRYGEIFTSFPFVSIFLRAKEVLGDSFIEQFGTNINIMAYNLTFSVYDNPEGAGL